MHCRLGRARATSTAPNPNAPPSKWKTIASWSPTRTLSDERAILDGTGPARSLQRWRHRCDHYDYGPRIEAAAGNGPGVAVRDSSGARGVRGELRVRRHLLE